MPLADHQWRLDYSAWDAHPGASYTFGDLLTQNAGGVWTLTPPKISLGEPVTADNPQPRADGSAFGRDYRPGGSITFELAVDAVNTADPATGVADLLATLLEVWDAPAVRLRPRAVARLTGRRAGRDRCVYGRPRRFEVADDTHAERGHIQAVADFTLADNNWYSDTESSIYVPLVPASYTGFFVPFTVPWSSTPITTKAGAALVGGTRPTWPVISVTAGSDALVQPVITATNRWSVRLDTSIPPGTTVVIDTRPWARTILAGTRSYAGAYEGPGLSKLLLRPGTQEFVLRGTDTSGTASMTVRWRDAYANR